MVKADVLVDLRINVTVSFQEERIEEYNFDSLNTIAIVLKGAEGLTDDQRRILYKRAKDIAESQFDLDAIE